MTLSERLQTIAKFDASSAGSSSGGLEFIEEIKGYEGSIYYCNLCRIHLEKNKLEDHSNDTKHKELQTNLKDKETIADKVVLYKSELLSPTEDEFVAVKDIVLSCEKALKLVSDHISNSSADGAGDASKNENSSADGAGDASKNEGAEKMEGIDNSEVEVKAPVAPPRLIKGVMRAGVLANGLLMKGEVDVRLVLLILDKPTGTLMTTIATLLQEKLLTVSENKYDVEMRPELGCIVVLSINEPKTTCTISLTSTTVRSHPFHYYNQLAPPDPDEMLARSGCEEALQALRRARWFESKVYALPFCEPVMRVMRDLCSRVPTWNVLDLWTLQLLIHKCLSSMESTNISVGAAVQRVFECIAGGALLPDSPGLYDPCEREPTDLCTQMSDQVREDITSSAQHALRLIAFQQIYMIFDLPCDVMTSDKTTNKRKRTGSQSDDTDQVLEEKKEKR